MNSIFLYFLSKWYVLSARSKKLKWNRILPIGDLIVDRKDKAKLADFGSGTTVYDSSLIIGDVSVGSDTWIGPNTILDGSGKLSIGDNCSISAGVQIYTHDTVDWAISEGKDPIKYSPVSIGSYCYIGPNVIISRGVIIGSHVIIGANAFVNTNIPSDSKAWGTPAKVINTIIKA